MAGKRRLTVAAAAALALLVSLGLLACGGSSSKPAAASSQTPGEFALYAWAVGGHGTILATRDGGVHWTRQNTGTRADLYSVAFADASHGWVIGNSVNRRHEISSSVILVTSDGGRRWTAARTLKLGPYGGLGDVACAGKDNVWAAGGTADGSGLMLASNDGGATWTRQAIDVPSAPHGGVWRIAFVDARHGWGCTNGTPGCMLRTSDGGAHWQVDKAPPETGDIFALAPVGSDSCLAYGDRGVLGEKGAYSGALLVANEHGITWEPLPGDTEPSGIVAISVSRLGLLALGGRSSCAFMSSSDGGTHWTAPVNNLPIAVFHAAAFCDDRHGWATGWSGSNHQVILRTIDGGQTWHKSYSYGGEQQLFDIACPGSIGGTSVE